MSISKKTQRSLVILGLGIASSYFNPWLPIAGCMFALLALAPSQVIVNRLFEVNSLFLLFVFSVFSLVGYLNGILTIQLVIFYIFGAMLFYLYGSTYSYLSQSSKDVLLLFLVISFSIALQHIVVTVADIYVFGLINPLRHLQVLDSDSQRAVTQRTVEIALCVGALSFVFFQNKDRDVLRIKKAFVTLGLVCTLCTIHYVSRTGVAIALICLMIGFLFSNAKTRSKVFLFFLFIGAMWLIFSTEVFVIFAERESDYSNISNGGLRFARWEYMLGELWEHPWGIRNINSLDYGFAHNLWIDFGKVGGVLSMILLVLFSLKFISNTWKLVRRKNYPLRFPVMIFSVVFFLTLMTEPIHEGAPMFLFVFLLYCGCLQQETKSFTKTSFSNMNG